MEDHRNINFMRLLSDESTQSTLSSESCEYYQRELFDQLPSIQASRPWHNRLGGSELEEQLGHGQLSRGTRNKASTLPLRSLTMCIQGKKDARDRRMMETCSIGCWESWRQNQSINTKRVWAKMGGAIKSLLPWQHTLHAIEGKFGIGVKAYFVFLRYLVSLNLLHCAVVGGFILGPTAFYGRGNNSEPLRFGGNDSVLDFFLGAGYLDRSPVFFGFYTRGSLNLPCCNTPLLYLTGILTVLFLSLIMVLRRTTVGYKHTWMLGKRYSMNLSYKIFSGWDFTIQDPAAAALKHSFIRNDLKLFLEEQRFSMYEAQRTVRQWVYLYWLRFILNLLVLSLLGGSFYLIYFAMETSQSAEQQQDQYWLVSLLLQFLPPFTITFINLFLPHIFHKISSFEDCSVTTQVNTTLIRSIFLKLASLGIYLYFLFTTTHQQCRENHFGREMYKLCIFNFLATFCNAFLFNYPRKLMQEKYPSSLLSWLLGKEHFLIPFNVLDLVYSQTVSWVGIYSCPLLPLIGTVMLVATFYIKKFVVLRCCAAEQKMFRASNSSVLFHFMLLLGLSMAASSLGFNLYKNMVFPVSSCGPFANRDNVINLMGECVGSLPSLAQSIISYLASEAFALPLILTEIVIFTSYVSRRRANQRAIERLKDMLVMSTSDKRFLVKQHATMLRRENNTRVPLKQTSRRTPPLSATVENPSPHLQME
ncbi:transmembrane channel-like protein 7 [Aulostomus maculatus]